MNARGIFRIQAECPQIRQESATTDNVRFQLRTNFRSITSQLGLYAAMLYTVHIAQAGARGDPLSHFSCTSGVDGVHE